MEILQTKCGRDVGEGPATTTWRLLSKRQ
jgi:hypothetical protein